MPDHRTQILRTPLAPLGLRFSPATPDVLRLIGDYQRSMAWLWALDHDGLRAVRGSPDHSLAVHEPTLTEAAQVEFQTNGTGGPLVANFTPDRIIALYKRDGGESSFLLSYDGAVTFPDRIVPTYVDRELNSNDQEQTTNILDIWTTANAVSIQRTFNADRFDVTFIRYQRPRT